MTKYGLYTNEDEILMICYAESADHAEMIFMQNDDRLSKQDFKHNSLYVDEISVGIIDEQESMRLLNEFQSENCDRD